MPHKYLVTAIAALVIAVPAVSLANSRSPRVDDVEGSVEVSAPATRVGVTWAGVPGGLANWQDVAAGAPRQPTITIDGSVYPNDVGVQFLVNGVVDDRSSARPNGYDATGPRHGSTFHIYPDISLSRGDVVEARWVDRSSVQRSSRLTIGGSSGPAPGSAPPSPSPLPPIDGFPSPTNVGFLGNTGSLTPSGSITINTNGAVIEGRDISGVVQIRANNVTIRNNRIKGSGHYWIDVGEGTSGHLIESNTILGPSPNTAKDNSNRAIYFRPGGAENVTIRNNLILRARVGIGGHPRNTVIEGNYIGDNWHASGSHGTASSLDGANGVTYRGNTLSMPNPGTSSCAALYGRGPISNITYDGNLFRGGPNLHYAINGGYGTPKPHDPTNIKIINNVFERATVPNPWFNTGPSYTISGNTWDDGTPV